ncbi:MAG: hypothetical protein ABSD98_09145 [Candidatus Korobacteraceae bacterium]|jgi:hypothetical protein
MRVILRLTPESKAHAFRRWLQATALRKLQKAWALGALAGRIEEYLPRSYNLRMSLRAQGFVFVGTDNRRIEEQIFEAFLEIRPNFAGRPLKNWERGANPPDFFCHDCSGKLIGVELTEWLNASHIKSEKIRQNVASQYSRIIRSEHETPPRNIEFVELGLKDGAEPSISEQEQFRRELFEYIRQVDGILGASPLPRSLQHQERFEFPNHPTLSRYVAWIKYWPCKPSDKPSGVEWIGFPQRGGYYSQNQMLGTLIENIQKKTKKYSTLQQQYNLDELYLIAYYSRALLYSPPYSTLDFGFRDVADAVSRELVRDHGHFHGVFLFSPLENGEKVIKVWPVSA